MLHQICHFTKINEKDLDEIRLMGHPFDDDLLQRKDLAESLVQIIKNTKSAYVYNISAPYGTGKSFFLRRLKITLERQECLSIIYNSWEADYFASPLVPLVEGIITEIKRIQNKDWKNKLKQIGSNILLELEVATTALIGEIWKTCVPTLDRVVNNALKKKKAKKEIIEHVQEFCRLTKYKQHFKKVLCKITSQLKNPLVIIIDELDRCRPNYSVETLETIKHFFDVPNVIFILAIDRKQIESAVSVLYGRGIEDNCSEYLRKFIDYDFRFPVPDTHLFVKMLVSMYLMPLLQEFVDYQVISKKDFKRIVIPVVPRSSNGYSVDEICEYITDILEIMCNFFQLSLRAQEQLILQIRVFLAALNPKMDYLLPTSFILMIGLKFFSPEAFESYIYDEEVDLKDYFKFDVNVAKVSELPWLKLVNRKQLSPAIWDSFESKYKYHEDSIWNVIHHIAKGKNSREGIWLSDGGHLKWVHCREFTVTTHRYIQLISQLYSK